jgi:hypothetical protein
MLDGVVADGGQHERLRVAVGADVALREGVGRLERH